MIPHNRPPGTRTYCILCGLLLSLTACSLPDFINRPTGEGRTTEAAQETAIAATVSTLQTIDAATAAEGTTGAALLEDAVDFNGDGLADLIAGIPGLMDGSDGGVGGFHVLLGSRPDGIGSPDLVIAEPNMQAGEADSAGIFYILFSNPGQPLGPAGHLQWSIAGSLDEQGSILTETGFEPGPDELYGFSVREIVWANTGLHKGWRSLCTPG